MLTPVLPPEFECTGNSVAITTLRGFVARDIRSVANRLLLFAVAKFLTALLSPYPHLQLLAGRSPLAAWNDREADRLAKPYTCTDVQAFTEKNDYRPTRKPGQHPYGAFAYPLPYIPGQPPPPPPTVVAFTNDADTKMSDRVKRRCFNCSTTDTSTWRRSQINAGKVLCNKCGLFERTHSRSRPEDFPHKRVGIPRASSSSDGVRHQPYPPPLHQPASQDGVPAPYGYIPPSPPPLPPAHSASEAQAQAQPQYPPYAYMYPDSQQQQQQQQHQWNHMTGEATASASAPTGTGTGRGRGSGRGRGRPRGSLGKKKNGEREPKTTAANGKGKGSRKSKPAVVVAAVGAGEEQDGGVDELDAEEDVDVDDGDDGIGMGVIECGQCGEAGLGWVGAGLELGAGQLVGMGMGKATENAKTSTAHP